MTDNSQTNATQNPELNSFPAASVEQINAQYDSVKNLYVSFTDAVKALQTAEVYKIRALAHLDDGWLWILNGMQQAQINAQQAAQTTTSGSEPNNTTTSGSRDTASTDTKPAA